MDTASILCRLMFGIDMRSEGYRGLSLFEVDTACWSAETLFFFICKQTRQQDCAPKESEDSGGPGELQCSSNRGWTDLHGSGEASWLSVLCERFERS